MIDDPYYYSLKLFRVCGLHPESRSRWLYFFFCVNCCCFLCIFTLAIIGVAKNYDSNIFEAIDILQAVFLYIHLLGKYPTLFLKRRTLSHLLEQRSRFWHLENFDNTIAEECQKLLVKTTRFTRNFIISTILVVLNFLLQPILTGDLPVSVYVPTGWFHYINLIYWYELPAIIGSVYGSDLIFCSICVPIMVQFRLLAHKFENLNPSQMGRQRFEEELKAMVDHQNFLLEYCNQINVYMNPIFLNQVIVATAIICMQSFVVSQKEFLLPNKLKCLGYCFMEVVETMIYCWNAEMLSDASENVGNAAYNSAWYESQVPEVRKAIALVVTRSQKKIIFSGFGLVFINLKTFTQIFKTAMSFYSYLNTMVAFEHD